MCKIIKTILKILKKIIIGVLKFIFVIMTMPYQMYASQFNENIDDLLKKIIKNKSTF